MAETLSTPKVKDTQNTELPQQLQEIFDTFLETYEEKIKEIAEDMVEEKLQELLPYLKGEKGDSGLEGKSAQTPRVGIDYFTDDEKEELAKELLSRATPVKGIHYNDGKNADEISVAKKVLKSIKIPEVNTDEVIKKVSSLIPQVETPEDIKSKLSQLPVKEKWFDFRHIKGVPVDMTGKKRLGRGTGSPVTLEDLSSQCDGASKTFTVPAHTRSLGLWSTQFPIVYKPTTDFTTSGTTLTLTSEVSALESGQTLVFLYVAQ